MNATSWLRFNVLLAILTAGVLFCTWWLQVDYSRPNIEVLPHMKYTSAWPTFAANPNFDNGRTLQWPPAGTIARGELPLHFEATKEDAQRAGEELQNPYRVALSEAEDASAEDAASEAEASSEDKASSEEKAASAGDDSREDGDASTESDAPEPGSSPDDPTGSAAPGGAKPAPPSPLMIARQQLQQSTLRGGKAFSVFCVSCHGPSGAGDGPVAKRGFPPPPSMLAGKSLQMKDGQLFHILTYGQGSMPPMNAQLSRERRWDLVNYVRDLQKNVPPSTKQSIPTGDAPVEQAQPPSEQTPSDKQESPPRPPAEQTSPSKQGSTAQAPAEQASPARGDLQAAESRRHLQLVSEA